MERGSHCSDFHEIWYLNIFWIRFKKIRGSLKSEKITSTLHEDLCTCVIVSRWILVRMRNVSDKSCRENQNTLLCSVTFFWKLCCLWDNVKEMS
jgi:hypothetical protein